MSKATITIQEDDDGRVKAEVLFDPPLPPGKHDDEWLEKIPTSQLTAILLMDQVLQRLEGDYEVNVIDDANGGSHGPRH